MGPGFEPQRDHEKPLRNERLFSFSTKFQENQLLVVEKSPQIIHLESKNLSTVLLTRKIVFFVDRNPRKIESTKDYVFTLFAANN
ncbi:MAG: hypothetical protein DCO96_06820 [Fluviicola sp. XM-24bin1]|nr:MAG: hypothetical protein DCO96_06820 [Fluviicola sp. XM-24bin1]